MGPRARVLCGRRRTPRRPKGLSWAAWWEDDAETVFAARERAFALYRERGDPAARRADGALDRRRPERLPRRRDRRGRLVRARAAAARAAAGVSRARLAGVPRGLPAPATASRRSPPPRSGAGWTSATSRCSASRSRAPLLVADGAVQDGMARLGEATVIAFEDRAQIPISAAWTCCFLVSSLPARLRLRARVRLDGPDRRLRRALRQPLDAGLLPRRVRDRVALARPLGRGGRIAGGGGRGLRALASGLGRRPARRPRRAAPPPGPHRRGARAARPRRPDPRRPALPRRHAPATRRLPSACCARPTRPLDRVRHCSSVLAHQPRVHGRAARAGRHGGDGAIDGARRPRRGGGAGRPGAARGRGRRVRGRAVRAGAGAAGLGRAAARARPPRASGGSPARHSARSGPVRRCRS